MRAWLQFTIKQFKITLTQDIEQIFDEDGKQLMRLNEIDFVSRTPEVNYTSAFILVISFVLKCVHLTNQWFLILPGGLNNICAVGNLEGFAMLWL